MIDGRLPREFGWYEFSLNGRKAKVKREFPDGAHDVVRRHLVKGYLVGDRVVMDDVRIDPDPAKIINCSERVHLIEPGLDRFVRVVAGRTHEGGPLIYINQEFPLGPEEEVLAAFLDKKESVRRISGVTPALEAAFRMEVWQRTEAAKRRAELERIRKEEEERRVKEERRRELIEKLGDGAGRREMAKQDFGEAARAALAVSGSEYLDHRPSTSRNEFVVRYRVDARRFECVCDDKLRIVDSGICLTAEYDQGSFKRGTKGDTFFTLESLPSVVREAERLRKLVVYRHVDEYDDDEQWED